MGSAEQERLLVVQGHDIAIDQLRHRRAHLPERDALRGIEASQAAIRARRQEVGAARDEVASRQAKAERELAATEARRRDVDRRMTSGAVSASRELQKMAEEVEHLGVRASVLEDEVLEAMTEGEPLDEQLAEFADELAALEVRAAEAKAAVAAAEIDIDAQLVAEQAARDEQAAGLSDGLRREYDQLRHRLGGVGAARLVGGQCSGCHLTLSSGEAQAARLAPDDELVTCEQCGRILVR